jgi:phosphate transport system permease protein
MSTVQETRPEPIVPSLPTGERVINRVFCSLSTGFAWLAILLVLYIVGTILVEAMPAIRKDGVEFLTGKVWDRNKDLYGILPQIWGTLYTSILALILGTIFGLSVAVFLNEGFLASFIFYLLKKVHLQFHPLWSRLPDGIEQMLKNLVQLLAAIPSVVYGLWGIYVIIPLIRPWCNWVHSGLSWIPLFGTDLSGPGILPASLVLSIMILPTIAAISQDALAAVPHRLREAAYGLGATQFETILGVIMPTAAPGVFGAIILAFGRALGETMALAMLAGNANEISVSLFSPTNTLAALLANNFGEASTERDRSVLMYAALILLAITLVVNMAGAYMLQRATVRIRGGGRTK